MKKDTRVRLKKLAATENPDVPSANLEEYEPGRLELFITGQGVVAIEDIPNEGKSLPVSYTLQGSLLNDVEVGQPLRLARTHRNGEEVAGFTETSRIEKFGPNNLDSFVLFTRNSVYLLEVLEQPKESN